MIIRKETDNSRFSLLAEEIAKAHTDRSGDAIGGIVIGKVRIGKTVYTLKVMRDVFMILDPELTSEEAYEMARSSLHFHLHPFLERVLRKQEEIEANLPKIDWTIRIPVLSLDDASLYAGVDLYFKDTKTYSAFQKTMTTIGTAVTGMLLSAPSDEALAKCLREYYDYLIIRITKEGGLSRLATIREWYRPRGYMKKRLRKIGEDEFSSRAPNKIYAKYLAERIALGASAVKELKEAVEDGDVPAAAAQKAIEDLPDFEALQKELDKIEEVNRLTEDEASNLEESVPAPGV